MPHPHQEGLSEVLASPQLQQSLSALTQAVHSDQLPVLLASLGLDPSVRPLGEGQSHGGIRDFWVGRKRWLLSNRI